MILPKLLRLKLIQLVKTKLIFFLPFFLLSCFGPIKELKYQIEDSWDDNPSYASNPKPLKDNFDNKISISIHLNGSFSNEIKRNLFISSEDDLIFSPSSIDEISALNITNFGNSWIYSHEKKIISGLVTKNKKLFFVDHDGYLISLSSQGDLEWKSFVGEVYSPPLSFNNSIVVKTTNNKFISLNTQDGSVQWFYQSPVSPLPIRSWGEMSFSNGVIYSGISSGKVLAINANNGLLIWESSYSPPKGVTEIERSNDTTSKVIVDEFALYVVSSNGDLSAISIIDGSILWKRPLSSFAGLAMHENYLYITHNSGSIYCIDKNTQKVIWRNVDLMGRDVSRGFVYQNQLIVSDYEGYLHFINLANGIIDAQLKISNNIVLEPILLNQIDKLFFMSISGDYVLISVDLSNIKDSLPAENKAHKDIGEYENNDESKIQPKNSDEESILDQLIFWD